MKLRPLVLSLAVVAAAALPAAANITSTSLRIQGAGLKVVNESVTTSIDLPVTIQTEFGGKQNDEAVSLEGVVAVGELTGPGLEPPIQLTTAPGHRFQIPGLSQQGVYYLQNVRLMKGSEFLQYATPAVATITVADLLQTKVSVRQLSPDELRARGIVIDARNYDVYEFSFTFIIDGKEVVIPFPVIIDPRTHEVQPVRGESEYVLPPVKLIEPPRWSPPTVIPYDLGAEEGELPEPGEEPKERAVRGARPSIPAAIVIPNSLAVLHQFFAVAIMVTNGAPEGSDARLEDLRATLKIPTALRAVKSIPQVAFGQPVPVVEPNTGATFLVAQARGEAEWTLEGLQPGTHRIDIEVRATLKQNGQDDLPLRATPSAAIVVHDPRFNINFSHPDVVRKGIEYSTYAFITNMSATEQTITVTNEVQSCDVNPGGNVCRLNGDLTDQLTIPAGDMRLIEYRLRSGVTGQVFATAGTLSDTDVLSATVKLHMGVSESGIPLSPATLVLPYYAQYVPQPVVSANLMLLGLGYSLATAPLNQMTAKFPRVIKTDVFARAVDIARAGQRMFITNDNAETKRDSLSHLALDLLGNGGHELREWDALRRSEKSGRTAGASVMRELETIGLANGATMTTFIDSFATATAHRDNFFAAFAHGAAAGGRPYALSMQVRTTGRRTDIPNEASEGWIREIPFSDISRFSGAGQNGELALLGRWSEDLDVKVTPAADGPFELDLLYPDTVTGRILHAHFALNGTAGQTITISPSKGAASLNARGANDAVIGVATIRTVNAAPLRLLGARQDLRLDKDGHKVSVLFNRPVKTPEGVDLRTRFTGAIDFNRDGVIYKAPRPISAAALQDDGRVVNTTFDHTLSQNATYTIEVGALVDPVSSQSVSFPDKVTPTIDNDLPGGVIYGKVIKGDNTPISGVDVVIRQYLPLDGSPDPRGTPQYDVSQADGAFLFEFVRRQVDADWSGRYRLEAISSVHGHAGVEGSVRLPGKVHFVNLQYLGRGAAEGTVKFNDGTLAVDVDVVVGSTMFNQFRSTKTDANGFYRVDDLPVGPLTFSAKDEKGNVTYAASEIGTPGQLVTQNLSIFRQPFPGLGRVYGVVRRSDTNAPVPGAHVGVYSQGFGLMDGFTDSEGRFDFQKVPAGFVTVLAQEGSVAPQSIAIDFDLKADEIKQVDVLLFVPTVEKNTTLTGEVWRENLLQPGVFERVSGAMVKIDGYRIVTADVNGNFTYENVPMILSQQGITAYDPATQRVKKTQLPNFTEAGPNHVAIFINAFDRGSGTIRVRLLNAAGQPVPSYRVIVPGFPPDILSNKGAGVYELPNVGVGAEYEIWAVPSGERPLDGSPDNRLYGDQTAHGRTKVSFNGHIAALTLRLPGQGTVRAKVRSQFDLISDVNLTYSVWFEGEQMMIPLTLRESTNKNGEADWAVFTKIPALMNYNVASAHPQYGYAAKNGQLAFDGDFDDHILQLNTLATVRGTVYAIDGVTPVAGASVRIYNGRSDPGTQITGPDGRFEFFDQPSSTTVSVTAEVTQSGVYRIGEASARTPNNGGVVENMAVVLRKRGFVDGKVVYKDYKVFDPDNVANNVPDNTPNDMSDNAPVPLAKFHLRELDFPYRTFGRSTEPLSADISGRFVINNVFVGSLRATAWDSGNEELRGDWSGSITEEGAEAAPKAYIAIGGGGVGAVEVTVVDPNQSYAEVANADVGLYRGGLFDFASTDATGKIVFTEVPVGSYAVSAYSKALGKTSRSEGVTVTRDGVATARLELEFSGTVDGTLTDPELNGAPVPGSHIRLDAQNYQSLSTTGVTGAFLFLGVREGTFTLHAKDTDTNRRASATRTLSILDPHRTVNLELEPTETLHFASYLPDDTGGNSGILAPPQRVEVVQRCYTDLGGGRHCDYERQLQGNPLQFPGVLENSGYGIGIFLPNDVKASIGMGGSFPKGTAADPFVHVWPAYGDVRVDVTQAGAPASGARVVVHGPGKSVTIYTDSTGTAIARGMRLGGIYVTATSVDERFTGSTSTTLARQSVMAVAQIALGTFSGVTGLVEAEAGGPSVGTRVVAHYSGFTGEMRTDASGRYTFLGIPTPASGTTRVNLTFIGPDDTTVGGATFKDVTAAGGTVTVGTVKLDATAPQLETILPADGSQNVSPDTKILVTFSEALNPGTIHTNNFQLVAADGSGAVNCALTSAVLPDGKFRVTMTPPQPATGFPLNSNTLYRVIVTNGVTDLTGHKLPATRGFTFTTSDYTEPRVQKVLPLSPIPRATTFEFRFNEPIDPTPWATGGSGTFAIQKLLAPGGPAAAVERTLISRAFLDPATNMTLFIAPDDVNPIEPESFYRVTFDGVRDPQGNVLVAQTHHFFSFDEVAPHVVFVSPAATEQLVSGSEYNITLALRNGSSAGTPATDVKEVRYFTIGADNLPKQFALVTQTPFSVKIIGPEAPPSGTTYTIGAQARDGSGNEGPMTTITWTVKPNVAPTNVVLTPQQTSAYPSTQISALVTFEDEGSFASVTMTFRVPRTNLSDEIRTVTQSYNRTAGGTWPEVRFTHTLPTTAQPGAVASLSATVTDVRGLVSTPATGTIEISADTIQPQIITVTPPPGTTFFNSDKYFIEAIVRDNETTVQTVTFTVDGEPVALGSTSAGPTPGTQKFRSVQVEARSKAEDADIPIVVTAKDFNNNARSTTFNVHYKGVNDPDAPKVTWLCPIDKGAIPADTPFSLKLRIRAIDEDLRTIKFVIGTSTPQTLTVTPSSATEYEVIASNFMAPAGPLTITAIVEDTVASHTIELPITLDVVAADFKYTDPKAITAEEAAGFSGKTIALIGSGAVLAPQVPLNLKNLLVLNGARVETLATTTTREFRIDVTTSGITYVDCDSRIDVNERGYVGGWANTTDGQNTDSHGRTVGNSINGGPEVGVGATHAGLAGVDDGRQSNTPYGSITNPTDLGTGGGGNSTCCNAGASGGGAVKLRGSGVEGDAARIVIAGRILASGGMGVWAPGAGGSIWIDAQQVLFGPSALLVANGGDEDSNQIDASGAGGGRIAVAAATKLDLSTAVLEARGGRTINFGDTSRAARDGGAGTIHIRKPGQEAGELLVSALDTRVPNSQHLTRSTPLGRIGRGTSTGVSANALTDSLRTFDKWMIGEELVLAGNTTRSFTVVAVSPDKKTLQTDPADGSMLDVATSQPVAYQGMLVFDRVTAGKRALLVFGDHVSINGLVDDKTAMTIDPTAAVVLSNEQVSLTMTTTPADGGNVVRDTSVSVTYSVTAAAGVRSVSFGWSLDSVSRVDTYGDYPNTTASKTITLPVPSTAPLGPATLTIRVVDRAGRTYDLQSRSYTVTENSGPVINSYAVAPESMYAGHDAVATVTATDDISVKTIAFDAKLNGTSIKTATNTPNTASATQAFTVTVPKETAGPATLTIDVAVSDGFAGRAATTATRSVAILADTVSPQLTIASPAANTSYRESVDKILVRVTAIDGEVAVKEAFAQIDGGTPFVMTQVGVTNEWRVDITAPPVDGEADVTRQVTITVKDYAGNARVSDPITVTIKPVVDANAPLLAQVCTSPNAMFPAGATVKVRVSAVQANAQNPVQAVEMMLDDITPLTVASLGSNLYEGTFVIPAGAADGTSYQVRSIARSAGGAASDLITTFTAIVGDTAPITASMTIDAANTTYENKTVIIQGGTVTIAGAHTFDRLIVLGGTITAPGRDQLQITTTRGTYFACGSTVDLNGHGYGRSETYPGATGVGNASAGAHIGRGGQWDAPHSTSYGSVYRPIELGGGGGQNCCTAGSGGGAVRIKAGTLTHDGAIRANGTRVDNRAGAGGSIWITAGRVSGAGVIETNGADGHWTSGGGGAIAVEYTDPASVMPRLISMAGNATGEGRHGGPGSIYTFGPESIYGDLRIDHNGRDGQQTQLPALGKGTAIAGTTATTVLTSRATDIPPYFAGHWVEISAPNGTLKGTWRISAVSGKSFTLEGENVAVAEGDLWQGVYRFDNITMKGVSVDSADPIRIGNTHVIESWVEIQSISAKNLHIKNGGLITHIQKQTLTLELSGELRVDAGGFIDLNGRGYNRSETYPGATGVGNASAGAHIGRGGQWDGPHSTSFGSIYRPKEHGGGGGQNCCTAGSGGGVLRVKANSVIVDGTIRANGTRVDNRAGAGGSIWITADRVEGTGSIQTNGADGHWTSGGGGAITIEYTNPATVLPTMQSRAGTATGEGRHGGPGSIYTFGPGNTYGDLRVDYLGISGQTIQFPALGSGFVQSVTGATVTTDRAADIPPYFAGHWVEISTATGTLKGTWRIATVSGKTFTLEGASLDVAAGDRWQGVYRFDNATFRGTNIDSADPIRVQNQTLDAWVEATSITAQNLTLKGGSSLTHVQKGTLTLNVPGELRIESGAFIDLNGRGYNRSETYPGATGVGNASAGAHIGRGGQWDSPHSTSFGSIYYPKEHGGGGGQNCCTAGSGGGVLRINAGTLVIDGTVRANGTRVDNRAGAGGSIWITAGRISGAGSIQTNGGDGHWTSGGGGAIAIEYTDPATALPNMQSRAGTATGEGRHGGAGSIYTFGPTSTYGSLRIDHLGIDGTWTQLPALGNGTVLAGSGGSTVLTNRAVDIPIYFVGHWVEIRDAATKQLKGTWRINAVSGKSFTLAGTDVAIAEGDQWQGVYRFDDVVLRGVALDAVDPIRAGNTRIESWAIGDRFTSDNMHLIPGASMRHVGGGTLNLEIVNELKVDAGAFIDLNSLGYGRSTSYPGAVVAGNASSGSHIGRGGVWDGPTSTTYGSLYRPAEHGAGGSQGCCTAGIGGGVLRVQAGSVVLNGTMRANGVRIDNRGAAGGSIWITAGRISGTGLIQTNGSDGHWTSGGGGAISVEYSDPTSSLPTMKSVAGTATGEGRHGGPGSVYTRGPQSTYGDLLVDTTGSPIGQPAIFPSFGRGSAMEVDGATVLTDSTLNLPPYFVGHWIDIYSPGGSRKGTWRIAAILGKSFTLEPNGGVAPSVAVGDTYRGVYLFDTLTLRNSAVILLDDIRWATRNMEGSSSMTVNDAPVFDQGKLSDIVLQSRTDGDFIIAPPGTINDLHPPVIMTATNRTSGATFTANALADGSFRITVGGEVGDTFTVYATDSNALPARTASVPVNGAIQNLNAVAAFSVEPTKVTGGTTVNGTIRMLYPVVRASAGVVTLSASGSSVTLPATATIPIGASSTTFPIPTSVVAADEIVSISATSNGTTQAATLTLLAGTSALTDLVLTPDAVEGGTSINGTVFLGAPAPAGGALVALSSSDTRLATVPDVLLVPEGSPSMSFTVTTMAVGSNASVTISGNYGAKISRSAALTACTALGTVAPPSSISLDQTWLDDAVPSGAVKTGDAVYDASQTALGAAAIHFSGTGPGVRGFASVGATTPLNVGPNDNLVLYALVNPCNPPKQILVDWKAGTNAYHASWGEHRIDVTTIFVNAGPLPATGSWTRLEVSAKALGITGSVAITDLVVRMQDGEGWIDAVGKSACTFAKQPAPPASAHSPHEAVWFDDDIPVENAVDWPAGTPQTSWTTAQVASGSTSFWMPHYSGAWRQMYFENAQPVAVTRGDQLFVWVLLNPCNPPRQIMLAFKDDNWEHRAYWGEDLIETSSSRHRAGPLPETGKWVRLQVPLGASGIGAKALTGMAFKAYGGEVWFDRISKITRVNVAYGKPATQSSTYVAGDVASRAVEGNIATGHGTMSVTAFQSQPWWQVDLGAVYPIDTIDIYGRTDCCVSQTSNIFIFVSDVPFTSNDRAATVLQPGVSAYGTRGYVGSMHIANVKRTGRYIRIHEGHTDHLSLPEVEVWTAVAPLKVNLAAGRSGSVSASSIHDSWFAHYALNGAPNAGNGSSGNGSIFHTQTGNEPWWELDLGSVQPISSIDLWGRVDTQWTHQMNDSYVFVSDVPFTSKVLADTINQPGVSMYYHGSVTKPYLSLPVHRTGRYLRVQKAGTSSFISFAQVEVWAQQPSLVPLSKPRPTDR